MSRVRMNLGPVRARYRKVAADALGDVAEVLLEESNRTAPIEESVMIGSGDVDVDPKALAAAVSYDTPYVVRQHEDTRLRHDPGRRAKWLERTFDENAPRFTAAVGARMKARLR